MDQLSQVTEYVRARFGLDETGATAVEYGLLVALIAAVIITAVTALGGRVDNWIGRPNF